jgi:hypothetical protein
MNIEYLGYSVYAISGENIRLLTASNCPGPSNTLIAEPEVVAALERYAAYSCDCTIAVPVTVE